MVNGDFKAFLSLKDFWIDEFTDHTGANVKYFFINSIVNNLYISESKSF